MNLKTLISHLFLYNPSQFWARPDKFLADPWQYRIFPQQRWLSQVIKLKNIKTVLEVGCGFGRNLKYLVPQHPQVYFSGVDISSSLLTRVPKILPLIQANAVKLPYKSNSFDLVFTHGTLMHLPLSQARLAINEIIRASRKWVIIIEETRSKPQFINYFTFAHDYQAIIGDCNLKVLSLKKDTRQLVWYLCQKLI